MEKAYYNIRQFNKIIWIIVCLILFNLTSCGLDTFYILDPPKNILHQPSYTNIEKIYNYFEFETNENGFDGSFKFTGTDVYYKIYNNHTTMQSEVDRIITLADSETNSSSAIDYLINKDKYSYSKLIYEGNTSGTLVPYKNKSRKVRIRLTDFQNEVENSSRITIDGAFVGIPLRNSSDKLTFNFGRNSIDYEINKIPVDSDDDVKLSSSSSVSGEWYVAMFAVASGWDTTFAPINSVPLYLGSVTIDSNSEDN